MPTTHCPSCSAKLRFEDSKIGRSIRCPKCQTSFISNRPKPIGNHDQVKFNIPHSKSKAEAKAQPKKRNTQSEDIRMFLICPNLACEEEIEFYGQVGEKVTCDTCGIMFLAKITQTVDWLDTPPPIQETTPKPVFENLGQNAAKFCHACGKKIDQRAEICPHCGVRQASEEDVYGLPQNSPNKVVACLLALFLGLLGVHKFYLGESTSGIIYLLFNIFLFWTIIIPFIFAIICLIEGIVYLTYSDREFAALYGR